jgi:hypothetical protein
VNFDSLGYKYTNIIYNLGMVFLIIEIYGLIILPLVILLKSAKIKVFEKAFNFISNHVFLSFSSRLFIETFLFIMISSIVNIKAGMGQGSGDIFSYLISYIFPITLSIYILAFTVYLMKVKGKIPRETVMNRLKNLLYDLDSDKKWTFISFYFAFIIRRVFLIILIFAISNHLVL